MKILFYFENRWIFGKLHNELIKVLYPEIYCDILDASIGIMPERMHLFLNKYDYIVTTPWAGITVVHKQMYIPLNKIVAMAHGELDITAAFRDGATDDHYNELGGYIAVSDKIRDFSKTKGITRVPEILGVGVFSDLYKKEISKEIKTIGYVGCFHRIEENVDIKRGYIAERIANINNLYFKHVNDINFLTVEQMYQDIDILIFCSLTEGNPYSAIEAFASGVPVIGTDVGIFKKLSMNGGGFVLPVNEDEFIAQASSIINYLKENPEEYNKISIKAKEASKQYDWFNLKSRWIDYFSSLQSKK